MELDSFAQLEDRIKKAMGKIEKLAENNKSLADQNEQLNHRVKQLEGIIKEKDRELKKASSSNVGMNERVKEKLESLLGKIEDFERSAE